MARFRLGLVGAGRMGQTHLRAIAGSDRVDSLVGETATATEDIPSGGVGKAELRGTTWTARNSGSALLAKNTRCRVERVDGLTIWIRPE